MAKRNAGIERRVEASRRSRARAGKVWGVEFTKRETVHVLSDVVWSKKVREFGDISPDLARIVQDIDIDVLESHVEDWELVERHGVFSCGARWELRSRKDHSQGFTGRDPLACIQTFIFFLRLSLGNHFWAIRSAAQSLEVSK